MFDIEDFALPVFAVIAATLVSVSCCEDDDSSKSNEPKAEPSLVEARSLKGTHSNACYWKVYSHPELQPRCDDKMTKCIVCFSDEQLRCVTFNPDDCVEKKVEVNKKVDEPDVDDTLREEEITVE